MFSVAGPSVPVDVECRRHGGTTPRELANKIICELEVDVDVTRRGVPRGSGFIRCLFLA